MLDRQYLLTDDQVLSFINYGYHLVEPDFAPGFNEAVLQELRQIKQDPGNAILEAVPQLQEVYNHPMVRGALISLLGADMTMNGHRHCHTNLPGSQSQGWHQDGTNVRHHQVWTVLAMYYPQDVPPEMGPTAVVPGTHFRNAPTDRMVNYANLKGQVFLTVKAGTVAITHYDLWHAATLNRTEQARYMLKFLFDRRSAPTTPSWNHDPIEGPVIATSRFSEMIGPSGGYSSDYYKEWELRMELWNWLTGSTAAVPPGAFKDMLS